MLQPPPPFSSAPPPSVWENPPSGICPAAPVAHAMSGGSAMSATPTQSRLRRGRTDTSSSKARTITVERVTSCSPIVARHAGEAAESIPGLGPEAVRREPEAGFDPDRGLPPRSDHVPPVPKRARVDASADQTHAGPVLEI